MTRQRKPKNIGNVNAVSGSGARAVYTHHAGMLNNLEFSFVTDEGEQFTVTMDFNSARQFLNESIAAYQAIMQPLQIARNVPFGE